MRCIPSYPPATEQPNNKSRVHIAAKKCTLLLCDSNSSVICAVAVTSASSTWTCRKHYRKPTGRSNGMAHATSLFLDVSTCISSIALLASVYHFQSRAGPTNVKAAVLWDILCSRKSMVYVTQQGVEICCLRIVCNAAMFSGKYHQIDASGVYMTRLCFGGFILSISSLCLS